MFWWLWQDNGKIWEHEPIESGNKGVREWNIKETVIALEIFWKKCFRRSPWQKKINEGKNVRENIRTKEEDVKRKEQGNGWMLWKLKHKTLITHKLQHNQQCLLNYRGVWFYHWKVRENQHHWISCFLVPKVLWRTKILHFDLFWQHASVI